MKIVGVQQKGKFVKKFVPLLLVASLAACGQRQVDELAGQYQCSSGYQRFIFRKDGFAEWQARAIGGSMALRGKFSTHQGMLTLDFKESELPDLEYGGQKIEPEEQERNYRYEFQNNGHLVLHPIQENSGNEDIVCDRVDSFDGPLVGPSVRETGAFLQENARSHKSN